MHVPDSAPPWDLSAPLGWASPPVDDGVQGNLTFAQAYTTAGNNNYAKHYQVGMPAGLAASWGVAHNLEHVPDANVNVMKTTVPTYKKAPHLRGDTDSR